MFCSKCQMSLHDDALNCPRCGAEVTALQASPVPVGSMEAIGAPESNRESEQPGNLRPLQHAERTALASVLLGILSPAGIVTGFVSGVGWWLGWLGLLMGFSAIVLGHIAKSSIRETGGRQGDQYKATAGLILGYGTFVFIFVLPPMPTHSLRASNATAAAAAVRILNASQETYAGSYQAKGFAASLAELGPGQPATDCASASGIDSEHACLIDDVLGCAADVWCNRAGYRFHLTGICAGQRCTDYVITATPQSSSSGRWTFCSTGDKVIRMSQSGVLPAPVTAEECRSWTPAG